MKRAEVLVRLGLERVERNGSLEICLRLLEPAEPLQAKAARLIQGGDAGIVLLEQVEAVEGFGITPEIEQGFALSQGLEMLRQMLRCDRFGLLLGRGPALLAIHDLTRRRQNILLTACSGSAMLVGSHRARPWCPMAAVSAVKLA
ncbi:hypothetical protein [Bradyrhizobium betae]|uniref:hypothetical protein n=1 Tax=Bradyrhizobium betae TaxID=244734 RepID=UPI001FE13F90|nr:hypothetical protein [Bradyrhizobium betae]